MTIETDNEHIHTYIYEHKLETHINVLIILEHNK